jgi:hypothetical protein
LKAFKKRYSNDECIFFCHYEDHGGDAMSWQVSGNGLGTPVLPGEFEAIGGNFYFEPETGFDIGTPGSDSYGIVIVRYAI